MTIIKVCWIKNKKNKTLLVPSILIFLLTIGMCTYSSILPMKILVLNFNIILPIIVGAILKATFGFEEHNNNYEVIKLIGRRKWLLQLNINNIIILTLLLFPLLFISYIYTNNLILCLGTLLTGIFWIVILSTIELILNSNLIIIISCIFVPIIAFFGITNNMGNLWKIFPFMYIFHIDKYPIFCISILVIIITIIFLLNNIIISKIDK